jgi:hypothetical protein
MTLFLAVITYGSCLSACIVFENRALEEFGLCGYFLFTHFVRVVGMLAQSVMMNGGYGRSVMECGNKTDSQSWVTRTRAQPYYKTLA